MWAGRSRYGASVIRHQVSTSGPCRAPQSNFRNDRLGLGNAIRIEAAIAREIAAVDEHHSSSGSKLNPWLSTTLPLCVIGT
jgi:hypothetical protein